MQNFDSGESNPIQTQPVPVAADKPIKARRWPWILLGLLFLLVGAAGGIWSGYNRGMQERMQREAGTIAVAATTQFELGQQDLKEGRYEMARQRFEYVVQIYPSFPGITEKLTEVMLAQARLNIPTAAPKATVAPVLAHDYSGVEEILAQARVNFRNREWDATINMLDTLRKEDLTYAAVEVDGMYYMSLRFRGIDKILKGGQLAGGTYDLSLAQQFAPLDSEADAYRNWAQLYMIGAGYWKVDWPKVIDNLGQVVGAFPNLRDGSNYTALERYRVAYKEYGLQLMTQDKYCDAQDMFEQSLNVGPDPSIDSQLSEAQKQCEESKKNPDKKPKPTEDNSTPPPDVPPTETPTPTDVAAPVADPTETPAP